MYSEKTIKHFANPINCGEINKPDAVGEAIHKNNGNFVKIWIKTDGKNIILDAKFKCAGCVPAIAAANAITGLAKGKTIETARNISTKEVLKELGGLPTEKKHTVILALKSLKNALDKLK